MGSNWQIHLAFTAIRLSIEEIRALKPGEDATAHQLECLALVKKHLGIYFPEATVLPGQFAAFLFNPLADNFDWLLAHIDNLEKTDVQNLVDEALIKAQSLLPNPPGIIYVLPGAHPQTTNHPMLQTVGLVGDARPTLIRLYISPVEGWQNWLNTVIAHEYNHYVRFQTTQANNLIGQLIFEGLAEAYSQAITPHIITPYTQVDFIAVDDIRRIWQIMSLKLEAVDYATVVLQQMSGQDKAYSFLSKKQRDTLGYTVGYQIVQSYINRRYTQNGQAVDWLEITQLDSTTILNESNFALFG